jgi:hypothetical protein
MLNFLGYLTVQLSQSCKHSSPSSAGSVFGNNCVAVFAVLNPLVDKSTLEALGVKRLTRFFSMFRDFSRRDGVGDLDDWGVDMMMVEID